MYRALYRKWRPHVFSDVAGQPHITTTLQNSVLTGRISHAYLFTGSRGTGKTSCAKILAKAVNCLDPKDGNPCNECEICKGIDSGAILDVTEIDAASNNGVDNIRDLREETSFTPSVAKYRVYIIDEVHMLSAGAFNALLKTLEEPPEYIIFVLATTEVHKLPATILSRCQRFDFRRIPANDIADRLMFVAKEEKIELSFEAAMLIARIADGSLRDALSVLDQCASLTDEVTVSIVSEVAGLLGKDYLFELSAAINDSDAAKALNIIDMLHNSSCDMERLLSELVNHFRNIMIAKTVKNPETLIVCTPEELVKLKDEARKFTYASLLSISETLCAAGDSLKYSSFQRAETETLIMRLCTPAFQESNTALLRRIADLERDVKFLKNKATFTDETEEIRVESEDGEPDDRIVYNPKPQIEEKDDVPAEKEEPKKVLEPVQTPERKHKSAPQSGADGTYPLTDWPDVLAELAQTSKPVYSSLIGSSCEVKGNLAVIKAKNNAFELLVLQDAYAQATSDAIYKITGKKLRPTVFSETLSEETGQDEHPLESFIKRVSDADTIEMTVKE